MRRIIKLGMSALPLLIIFGLLYAGLFVKPQAVAADVQPMVIERADKFYGIALTASGGTWAAGSNGKILHSNDAGHSWKLQTRLSNLALQDVAAWDELRAVAVGDDGVVMITADGGKAWRTVTVPRSTISNKLIRVKTLPLGEGWAVGEGGAVLHTVNFGLMWTQVGAPEDTAWNDIAFHHQRAVMVGEFGLIRLSTDGGVTWATVTSTVKSSLMAVAFQDPMNAVAVGLGGVVLRSMDGGASWKQQKAATNEHLFDVLWDGKRWVAVGDKGILLAGVGDQWRATRNDATARGWYTRIAQHGSRYYFAGSALVSMATGAL